MGLSIGSNIGNLRLIGGTETYSQFGRVRQQTALPETDPKNSSPLFSQDTPEPDKVGFGDGTVSLPGIAVKTIGYSREGSTQIVETLQEAQTRIRERQSQARTELSAQEETPAAPPSFDFRSAGIGAVDSARTFINGLSNAAGSIQSRLEGTPPPDERPQINIRVGDETIPFARSTQQPTFEAFV
ncbi:MAG: hypothetical protein K1Y02_12090 [Candidatus Hydrogenedentes bacterium]|nr:hypothetical protein [Candidatus Hydrogenedentota bacterium]